MVTMQTAMSRRLIIIKNAVIEIKIGVISTAVYVVILPSGEGRFVAEASHGIKTDLQAGVYWIRDRVHNTPGGALHDAFSAFSQFYWDAVGRGFEPNETWLVQKPAVSSPPPIAIDDEVVASGPDGISQKQSRPCRKQLSAAAPTKRRTKGKARAARRR